MDEAKRCLESSDPADPNRFFLEALIATTVRKPHLHVCVLFSPHRWSSSSRR